MWKSSVFSVAIIVIVYVSCQVQGLSYSSEAEADRVNNLPGLSSQPSFSHFAGYINIDNKLDKNLFYWFFESESNPETAPLVLWMTGGPGCSSELAVLFENGPWAVANDGKQLTVNKYSWNKVANVIYIDQPVGAGFSYSTIPGVGDHDEAQIGDDVYSFLQLWFKRFPAYQSHKFYIFGESYGGHYVPTVSNRILNGKQLPTDVKINLLGAAVGNGMTDPLEQYGAYALFAYSHGLISQSTFQSLDPVYAKCRELIIARNMTEANDVCDRIISTIMNEGGNFNVYDVTKTSLGPLGYDLQPIINYLNQPSVMSALHVASAVTSWVPCNNTVNQVMSQGDWFSSQASDVAAILAHIPFMTYTGRDGFICNFLGQERWVNTLSWSGKSDYDKAASKVWTVGPNQEIAGYMKSGGGLFKLVVNNSGHMVPYDQPLWALILFSNFINKKSF